MVTVPLILLAIPSVFAGWAYVEPMLFGDWFGSSIFVREPHAVHRRAGGELHGAAARSRCTASRACPFWLALAGIATAVVLLPGQSRDCPARIARAASARITTLLDNKYYFDRFNDWFFAGGARWLGNFASTYGDRTIIDGIMVNGTAQLVGWSLGVLRRIQSGYIYHYAFTMIIGVFALLTWWVRCSLVEDCTMTPYLLARRSGCRSPRGIAVLAIGRDRDAGLRALDRAHRRALPDSW